MTRWRVNDGLPQNEIRGLAQTPDGYLWIATLDGLARFDGVRFTTFNKANSPGISSNRMTGVCQGVNGDLWIPYERGGLLRLHQGKFRSYGEREGINAPVVTSVLSDASGHIWILSGGQIQAWDGKAERFIDLPGFMSPRYNAVSWGPSVGTYDRDHVYFFKEGQPTMYLLPQRLRGAKIRALAYDTQQTAWVETSSGKQVRLAAGDNSQAHELPDAMQVTLGGVEHHLWTANVGADLSRSIEGTLAGERVEVPFRVHVIDAQGNLWLGTTGDGLYRVQRRFINVINVEQGLLDKDVYPIYQDTSGVIWIGTWNKGLSEYRDGHFRNYTQSDGLPGRLVTSLWQDNSGTLWIATHGGLVTHQNGRLIPSPIQALPDVVQAIFESRDGSLWFGMRRGLARWSGGTLQLIDPSRLGLPSLNVNVIAESTDGDLWFGGSMGLLQKHGDRLRLWSEKDGFISNNVWSLLPEADGTLWIGTFDGGLMRLREDKLTHYTTRDGLFNDGVFQILDDGRGYLWISCDRGIYRLSKRELVSFATGATSSISPLAFGAEDGLVDLETNGGIMPAGIRSRDGKLWFPTQDGVAIVDPFAIPESSKPPRAIVESLLVDQVSIPNLGPVRLAPNHDNLQLQYTAPSFDKPEQMRFRYRLKGLDAGWTQAGQRRVAFYTHVPSGTYTFRVSAANAGGAWGPESSGVVITILAPFYKTWWFRTFVALLLIGIFALIWRYRLERFRRAQAQKLAFLQQLISSQENERKRIAGELHDSLGQRLVVINAVAQLSLGSQESKSSPGQAAALEEIREEALAAIQDTRAISYDLRPIHLDRFGLTRAIDNLVKNVASASAIAITRELDDIDEVLPEYQRINLYRIVQESLSNLVKYSRAKSGTVHIQRSPQSTILTIGDDGIGFDAQKISATSSGLGLRGIAERAALLGGELTIVSSAGGGTILVVKFPNQQNRPIVD